MYCLDRCASTSRVPRVYIVLVHFWYVSFILLSRPACGFAVASHDDLLRVHPQPKSCDTYFAWLFDPELSS